MYDNNFESFMVDLVKKNCDEHRIDNDLDIAQCDYRSFFETNEVLLKKENSQLLLDKFGRVDFVAGENITKALDSETLKTLVESHPESSRINALIANGKLSSYITDEYISLKYTDKKEVEHLAFELYINGDVKNEIVSWEINKNQDGGGFHLNDTDGVKALTEMINNIDSFEGNENVSTKKPVIKKQKI